MTEAEIKARFPTEAHWQLARLMLLMQGKYDALQYAWECNADAAKISERVKEVEEQLADVFLLAGPLKPGAHPRYYKDGYLAGLREALEIITRQDNSSLDYITSQPAERAGKRERTLAEESDESYHPADGS